MTTDLTPIVVEEVFKSSIEDVWNAITRHDLMIRWFFENIPDFRAEVGFETRFNIVSGGRDFLHVWRVTEAIPLKKIVYNWTFEGYAGSADLSMELFEENDNIRLVVTSTPIESFPQDIPEFKRESGLDGWNYFIKQRLKEFLS